MLAASATSAYRHVDAFWEIPADRSLYAAIRSNVAQQIRDDLATVS
jgi:hypothetical protein